MRIIVPLLLIFICSACREPVTPEKTVPIENQFRDTSSPELTNNDSKAWKLFSIYIDSIEVQIPECETDDRYIFDMTGSFLYEPVFYSCDSLGDENIQGSWYFTEEQSILILEINGSKTSQNVVQLSKDTFEIQGIAADSDGNYLGAQYTKMIPVL